MSAINVLFFSNNCMGSKQLITMMQSENLIRFFHLICVDNNDKIPPLIRVNPTPILMIKGIPTPYIAGDAFAWLSKIKQWKINMMMHRASVAQQQYFQNMNNNLAPVTDTTIGFSSEEMAGMSDIFAYLQTDNPAPQSFFDTSMMGQENIFTPPLENGQYKLSSGSGYRVSEEKQKKLQDELINARNKQDELIRMQNKQFRENYKG